MIIGSHEAFIGVKIQSVISSDEFTHFENVSDVTLDTPFYHTPIYIDSNPQAP